MPLTWTTNGRVWMALHDDQWAVIEEIETSENPFHAYVCRLMDDISGEIMIDTACWYASGKFETLEMTKEWAAEKMGVEK